LPSSHAVFAKQIKNWDPFVFFHQTALVLRSYRSGIRHAQKTATRVFDGKILISKFPSVNRFTAHSLPPHQSLTSKRTVSVREIAALRHETRNDAMELGIFKVQGFLRNQRRALFARAIQSDPRWVNVP
jgi:hypothetical protein